MKSRRLTLLCVALVALAGTPRAWQEARNLLAVMQHKAQVKFWSMVVQPKTLETADTRLIASARAQNVDDAQFDSNCPLRHTQPADRQASNNPQASGRRLISFQAKARARSQGNVEPTSHAGLIAATQKAIRESIRREQLRQLENLSQAQLQGFAESTGARPTPPAPAVAVASPARPPKAHKGDTFKFVMTPAPIPVVSALTDKESIMQLRILRKTLEDNKLVRKANRVKSRNADFGMGI